MKYTDEEQIELNYPQEEKIEVHDEFAASVKPLEELLDSVRDIEGFPIGKDEDILALSDPPYYTACPNPYINEFIEKYGKPYDPETDDYHRTPYVGDVSEGKNDPIYNAHSYHTKVPHKAIMKFIEHYTDEDDIVFDGFCGSGMTGVAAQLLNRRAILADLSPAATFIAYNYNTPVDVDEFEREAKRILREVEEECGWMYETMHMDGKTKGRINYTVWSEVLICPFCENEYVFWNDAVDKVMGKVYKQYRCHECQALLSKNECQRATAIYFDQALNKNVTQTKQAPVLINYSVGKHRFEKAPDELDVALIKKIEESTIPYWFPSKLMMHIGKKWGDSWRAGYHFGISHAHQFYTKRNLWVLSKIHSCIHKNKVFQSALIAIMARASIRNRYMPEYGNRHVGTLSGTLYVPTLFEENNLLGSFKFRLSRIMNSHTKTPYPLKGKTLISTHSLIRQIHIPNSSIDYIFTDPPFGDNLMYSELNFVWESWLKVFTNNSSEAIINQSQQKSLQEYKELMIHCFSECHRVLKPNRWLTVEFHNSKAIIWNVIQDSISKAGFIVAQVAVIDKKKGTTKQLSYGGTVKNDLVINAYKPKHSFSERFLKNSGEGMEIEFVTEHLNKLPIEANIERSEQMLYSKLIAHYVQRSFAVRYSARQYYKLLKDNFYLIDGFWFTEAQVLAYEEWKKAYGLDAIKNLQSGQQVIVGDEKSALTWLYQYLEEPKSYSDIYTAYHQISTQSNDIIPELKELLDNNFIFENKCYRRPHTDTEEETIEMQREKELERAFNNLLTEAQASSKRLKNVRKEALKHGFTKAYQENRFADILDIAKKLDKKILEENSEINDFVEIAQIKMGQE